MDYYLKRFALLYASCKVQMPIKKLLVAPEGKHGKDACTSSSMPEKVEEAGLKEGNSSKYSRQTYFRLSVADASISVNKNYR